MRARVILEASTQRNYRLFIAEDYEPGKPTLFLLDCDFDMIGKQYLELPRYYRTERGARCAAARITCEKLKWRASE